MQLTLLYTYIDPYLICLYRVTGHTFVDFLIGTFVLALITVVAGELTISVAYLASRKAIEQNTDNVVRYQNISVDAIEAGDKATYTAANKLANEAFGKSFFQQLALASGFLWPVPVALGWMQYRFDGVEFALLFTDVRVGYACVFIPLFAAAYLLFKRVKYRIPYFRRIKRILDASAERHKTMRSFADLLPQKAPVHVTRAGSARIKQPSTESAGRL
jgi:hypothetical protein